ncbi:hypothetical protein GCM10023115_15830 [Pontixanthobacter gangjinensis]
MAISLLVGTMLPAAGLAQNAETEKAASHDETAAKAMFKWANGRELVSKPSFDWIFHISQYEPDIWEYVSQSPDLNDAYELGLRYEYGEKGVEQDYKKAFEYYDIATTELWGHAPSLLRIGLMYEKGRGMEQQIDSAVASYDAAAQLGNVTAQSKLGFMYAVGPYGTIPDMLQNTAEALCLYRMAARQKHAPAQSDLGFLYYSGLGVKKDNWRAYIWWSLASAQGEQLAQAGLTNVQSEMTPEEITSAKGFVNKWPILLNDFSTYGHCTAD